MTCEECGKPVLECWCFANDPQCKICGVAESMHGVASNLHEFTEASHEQS